jgi:SpoVK/Ycf46/Vps4 family AAA+-type ATPase
VRRVRPVATLDRLVLPPHQHRLLRSVVERVQEQPRVLHEWGFGAAARHHGGARLLLAGPPGTGKSLAVEAVAAELGLDLLVVDLAALVSKWLGETEKNIGEVFDASERCQAVLFFDEADAIFARRTDSSDAQARWANLETAYLLGRIDRSNGVVALATNLRAHIDDAFLRRLDVVVELEPPDRAAREELWRRHLPPAAPCAGDVDPAALAAHYEITGGLIRNAALAAAFEAAAQSRPIDQQRLVAAVDDEYRKAGRCFPGSPRAAGTRAGGGT